MIASALEREESRGVHTRSDYPAADPTWVRPIGVTQPPLAIEPLALTPV